MLVSKKREKSSSGSNLRKFPREGSESQARFIRTTVVNNPAHGFLKQIEMQ